MFNAPSLFAFTQDDSARIIQHLEQARAIWYSSPDEAKKEVHSAIHIGEATGYDQLLAKSYNYLGIVYDIKDEYDSAMMFYNRALPLARQLNDTTTEASTYNNIGLIAWNQGHYDKAIAHYFKSLELFEILKKEQGIANTLNNIGLIYWEQERYTKAADYIKQSLTIREKLNDTYGKSAALANLGLIYSEVDKVDSSRVFLQQAIELKKELNDVKGLAIVYNNIAEVYGQSNQYDSGIVYLKKSIDLHLELDDKRLLASNYASLGWHYYRNEEYDLAATTYQEGLALALETDAIKEQFLLHDRLGILKSEQGAFQEATDYFKTALKLQDSLYNVEKEKTIIELQEKYEKAENEKELAMQRASLANSALKIRKRNYFLYGLSGLVLFSGLLGIIYYRQQKFKQERLREEAKLKDEIAAAELTNKLNEQKIAISRDLHDNIGAQLTLITSMVDYLAYPMRDSSNNIKEGLRQVRDYAQDTIHHLRDTVWAMKHTEISGENLFTRIREFTNRAQAATQVPINLNIHEGQPLSLSSFEAINIFRLVQEAINNAIKHASADNIDVDLHAKQGVITVHVADNGIGFDKMAILEQSGLSSLQSRAAGINAELSVDTKPTEGTTIHITYPGTRQSKEA